MFRRIISLILAIALFSYLGCHDTAQLSRDTFIAQKPDGDILLITKDAKFYKFYQHDYWMTSDSLKGSGTVTMNGHNEGFTGAIPLSDIDVVQIETVDGVKTVLCVLGIAALAAVIVAAVAAAAFTSTLNSEAQHSCPFVYTFDGTAYHLESETFSGAVLKGLERTSYDNLRLLKPVHGFYELRLSNDRPETEYVNELKLILVDHTKSVGVVPDLRGIVHTFSHPEMPTSCIDFGQVSRMEEIMTKDGRCWESDISTMDLRDSSHYKDGLIMEFAMPQNAREAKLLVNGVNTPLADFAFQKLFQLKGDNKLLWYHELERNPSESGKFLSWMKRDGMLHVKVWNGKIWQERAALIDVGPALAKDQVALLDIGDITGSTLKVKLECTTDLWRIDRVAIDYSPDLPVSVTELSPQSAITERGDDITPLFLAADDQYDITVEGQHANLTFKDIPLSTGLERSYILKTRGFYYQWFDTHGPANDLVVDRILTDFQFGAKQYLPQWKNMRLGK